MSAGARELAHPATAGAATKVATAKKTQSRRIHFLAITNI